MADRLTSPASLRGTLWTGRERDACGMGFVARRDGVADHRIVQLALQAIERISHRGAVDAGDGGGEPTGDGAGVLLQVPWRLLARELPAAAGAIDHGRAAVGMCFLPRDARAGADARALVERVVDELGATLLGWRPVPVDHDALGEAARATCPDVEQLLVEVPDELSQEQVEPYLYRLRRGIERHVRDGDGNLDLHLASLSSRTVVYKGLVVGSQLRRAFPDLVDPDVVSSLAVFHQRYSTNTFPSWSRAQPCRTIAHNGEINTLHGNVAWMRARLETGWRAGTAGAGDDGSWLHPVVDEDGSDSAMLDDAVQLLVHGGRDLLETLTMLVPPAWDHDQDLAEPIRDLLRVLSSITEPWDGPAAIAFSDGDLVGACLDRNGLRPARWLETDDGIVACASEVGAVAVDPASIVRSGRLGPGQAIALDTRSGILRAGDDVLEQLAAQRPWGVLAAAQQADVVDASLPDTGDDPAPATTLPLTALHALHGYTREELTAVLRPMSQGGSQPVGSMGDDTPIAALATHARSLFGFVRQGFAEVTNPAIDPLRERSSMSLDMLIGPCPLLLDTSADSRPALHVRSPVLTSAGLRRLRDVADARGVRVRELPTLLPADPDGRALAAAVEQLCADAEAAAREGCEVLVLSDRHAGPAAPPIPALLAASAVHQHLVDAGLRTRVGLVQETGEVRDAHQLAALLGHGIGAVCPWLALETARDLASGARPKVDCGPVKAQRRMVAALEAGLLTAMSRMGISTIAGYRGAQVFESVGLDDELAHHLRGTTRRPGRIGFEQLAGQVRAGAAHAALLAEADAAGAPPLPSPGFYKFKREGELHGFAPPVVAALQDAVAVDDVLGAGFEEARMRWRDYVAMVRERDAIDLRDLLSVEPAPGSRAIPLEEVEPVAELVRRFSTGAMSHGSLASEAHETLALGAHLAGAWSNSGEGGEDRTRFGTSRSSDVKQVASGRFGVTPAYLRSARELQVKIAQGSKPGEGGHLPGHKVTPEIARIRHTQPGVSLISPPPHHDIYSIEDLAQLVHDLACACPDARSSVKLVSQAGVGTIAAGVAKARADVIVVSGASGGTGASPLGSIKHAGMPWEWGIAETQQVLVANRLRGRVRLRVDGGLRTGRDVLVAALLGADEFSFGTAALVAEGCTMARTCHNDRCPVGIATQREDLRAKFPGRPEHVAAFLLLLASELRELLAALGARRLDDVIGRVDLLRAPDAAPVDLSLLLAEPDVPRDWPRRHVGERNEVPGVHDGLDARLAHELWPALLASTPDETVHLQLPIENTDRSVGARISCDIAERLDATGLDGRRAHVRFDGSAGQSFAAFAIRGLRLELVGEANDFVGKGLAGAHVDVRFPDGSRRAAAPGEHVLAGNACLYGATAGLLLAGGVVGERFAVRNSGADAVVEGAGDHLCEYMTGGTVVVLGATGRNVASGMTGGVLWVLDDDDRLASRLAGGAQVVDDPDPTDVARLVELLQAHRDRTGSARARELLEMDDPASRLRCVRPVVEASVRVAVAGTAG